MSNIIGGSIARLRREQGLTQKDIAQALDVSCQAVSRWERGGSLPDITMLPALANILGTSIDGLMGYDSGVSPARYEKRYEDEGYYWGTAPSSMCFEVMRLMPPVKRLRVLDIGCGEGKDAVFFARNGYEVTAFDIARSGLEKGRCLAEGCGAKVSFIRGDMNSFSFDGLGSFDVIFSSGAFHYMDKSRRGEILGEFMKHTSEGGIHALNVFVDKPFIEPAPDDDIYKPWLSGELFTFYRDWRFESCGERIFDCSSGGVPHKHCMDTLIARKIH